MLITVLLPVIIPVVFLIMPIIVQIDVSADDNANANTIIMMLTLIMPILRLAHVPMLMLPMFTLMQDTLQMYEVPPEGAGHSLKQAVPFQARPQPVSNGQDDGGLGEGGLTEDGPASPLPRERTHGGTVNADVAAMELLVAESVERIKRVVVSTCDGRLITDVIVRNVMDVIQVRSGCFLRRSMAMPTHFRGWPMGTVFGAREQTQARDCMRCMWTCVRVCAHGGQRGMGMLANLKLCYCHKA